MQVRSRTLSGLREVSRGPSIEIARAEFCCVRLPCRSDGVRSRGECPATAAALVAARKDGRGELEPQRLKPYQAASGAAALEAWPKGAVPAH